MSTGLGTAAKCGLKELSTWTDSWSAVDTMIPIDSESIETTINQIEDMGLEGSAAKRESAQGIIELAGTLSGTLDYSNWGSILQAAFGVDTAGVYTFEDNLGDIIALELEKSVSRWRVSHAKIQRLSIEGTKGEALKIAFDIIGKTPSRSATAFPSISLSTRSMVLFSNSSTASYIRIGDQSDALAEGDNQSIESFKFEINNNLKADDFDNASRYVLEPLRNGFREVTFSFKLPRYSADTFQDAKANGTRLQAILYFTDGTTYCQLEIPEFKIFEGANSNVSGPEILTQEISGICYKNKNNTPLVAITDEARLTIKAL